MPSRLMSLGCIMVLTLGAVLARPAAGLAKTNAFTTLEASSLGATNTAAQGINPQGDIVGNYTDRSGKHGFLLSAGDYSPIDVSGATATSARDINPQGDVVGWYADSTGQHGFLRRGGSDTQFDFPGATLTNALGINPQGDIVGRYTDILLHEQHGFLLRSGTYTTLDVPGATLTNALGINPQGEIVGFYTDSMGRQHGFLHSGDDFSFGSPGWTTLDATFPGTTRTLPRGINAQGDIVGGYDDRNGDRHAFLLCGGKYTTLDWDILVQVPGATDIDAFGVNPRGDVVGAYVDSSGVQYGFVLTGVR